VVGEKDSTIDFAISLTSPQSTHKSSCRGPNINHLHFRQKENIKNYGALKITPEVERRGC